MADLIYASFKEGLGVIGGAFSVRFDASGVLALE